MNRRDLIGASAALGLSTVAGRVWAAPKADARLLVVFLRGAYDAANVVIPTGSDFYYRSRPNLAITKPDGADPRAALALDADWSLHPALRETILPLYAMGQAAFVPFAGTDDLTRSHFETQDTIEMGQTVGTGRDYNSGFMARLAAELTRVRPIAFADQMPLIFRGGDTVPNIAINGVGKPGIGQDAINTLLIDNARAGRRVVRLKGGDTFVFGRGGEEIEALRQAGVRCSVIPGITAGIGAAAQFEVPLTFRHEALRVTFLTAHKAEDAEAVNWSALTDTRMTVVVYMGMTAAPTIRDGLLAAGRSPHTPVGVFARATRPDAHAEVGTLAELPDLVARIDGGPAILIIGNVVAHSAPWFSKTREAASLAQRVAQHLEAAE